jgi:uncharacterized protein (TIGR03000 family)
MFRKMLSYGGILVVASAAVLGGTSYVSGADDGDYHRSLYRRDPYYGQYTDDYGDGYPYYDPQYQSSPNPMYNTRHDRPPKASMSNGATETAPAMPARIRVIVPADARIFVDGTPTSSTGTYRRFHSPPLDPGRSYSYKFSVRWNEAGKEVTQTRSVDVTAGANVDLRFPIARNTANRTSNSLPQPRRLLVK